MSSYWFSFEKERIGWLEKGKNKRARKGKLGEWDGTIKKRVDIVCMVQKLND